MTDDGVHIPLEKIYEQVIQTDKKVDRLATAVGEMVAVNKRLDAHHKTLAEHDQRINVLEQHKAVVDSRTRAPWYAVTGAVVGIVAGVVSLITLLSILGDIAEALGGK